MEENKVKIEDARVKGWFHIDNYFIDEYAKVFGTIGSAVFFSLCRHAGNKKECFPSEELIAKEFGITSRTVRTYIKVLEQAGVIRVDRGIRNGFGKWRHNFYTLEDKSKWKQPEEMISASNDRKIKTEPKENKDTDGRKEFLIKNTNEKNTNNNKTNTAKQGFAVINELVNEIIKKFSPINPNYKKLLDNITQRKTVESLVEQFGSERVMEWVEILPDVVYDEYCPTVTTPYELKNNLSRFLVYLEKKEREKTGRGVLKI